MYESEKYCPFDIELTESMCKYCIFYEDREKLCTILVQTRLLRDIVEED